MAIKPRLNRDQLAKFLPSQEAIIFFENLFETTFSNPSMELLFPVGSVQIRADLLNPGDLLGIGTWVLTSKQRALVGYDSATPPYDVIGATGGAFTHTLTTAEMPTHTHVQDSHNHTQNSHSHVENLSGNGTPNNAGTYPQGATVAGTTVDAAISTKGTTATNNAATATNQNTGSGNAHNNVSPYTIFAIWTRTV